jgi:hypothetical protein
MPSLMILRVHAELDDLESNAAADGLGLFGHVNDAHAAFADALEKLVAADAFARFLERRGGQANGFRRGK